MITAGGNSRKRFQLLFDLFLKDPEGSKLIQNYAKWYPYLRKNTGSDISKPNKIMNMFDAFKEIPAINFYGRSNVESNIQHAVEKDIGDGDAPKRSRTQHVYYAEESDSDENDPFYDNDDDRDGCYISEIDCSDKEPENEVEVAIEIDEEDDDEDALNDLGSGVKDLSVECDAIFRHGHRTNDLAATYPNDPYKNYTFWPYGHGQLTNTGKQREFDLGQKLHKRYGKFLDMYTPEVIDSWSTNFNRTKMSLELVLAGLFPPEVPLNWSTKIMWQPIPYNSFAVNDNMLAFPSYFCQKHIKLYEEYRKTPEGAHLFNRYRKWYPYLQEHTGMEINSLLDLFNLYFTLITQKEFGLTLPEWTNKVFPLVLTNGVIDFYRSVTATMELNKLSQGFTLKMYLDTVDRKINGDLIPKERKMLLYSAHEINVASMLRALKVYTRHIPDYGSCVLLELHLIDGVYYIKIYYEDHTPDSPKLLKIPGCNSFCPLDQFKTLLKENVAENYDLCKA
ncbi:hypothetical protein FQA39_LY02233 [Lamprigera yunnana]|nr:hypothetical protein FQA39_LY02233 [Lamprigera yunnana]